MLPRRQGVEYDASHHGEYFYIRTNDGAKNFRLMRTEVWQSFQRSTGGR
jgi:oligopeptidase B